MNILYINEDNYGGGSSKALLIYAREMKARKHGVFVLTRDNDGYIIDNLKKLCVKVYLCDISFMFYINDYNIFRWIKRKICFYNRWQRLLSIIDDIICEEKIDVVHANCGLLYFGIIPSAKRNVPHVLHHREFFDKFLGNITPYPSRRYFFNLLNSPNNYNICITRGILDYLKLEPSERNRVIYDGIIDQNLSRFNTIQKENYFLYAGRIEANKGLDMLLSSFAIFHKDNPDIILKVAGAYDSNDDYYLKCKDIIEKNDLADYVEILGFRLDIEDLMKKAVAIVVPSLYEGFGFILVEGMKNNTLMIGYNSTGTKEQFDLGLNQTGEEIGLRFSNQNELVRALSYAINNDTTSMRHRAYDVVYSNYTVERCINETEDFYNFVVEDYKQKENRKQQ